MNHTVFVSYCNYLVKDLSYYLLVWSKPKDRSLIISGTNTVYKGVYKTLKTNQKLPKSGISCFFNHISLSLHNNPIERTKEREDSE